MGSVGEDTENLKPSCTSGRNVKFCKEVVILFSWALRKAQRKGFDRRIRKS